MTTGRRLRCTTALETLPSSADFSAERPREPITTAGDRRSSARRMQARGHGRVRARTVSAVASRPACARCGGALLGQGGRVLLGDRVEVADRLGDDVRGQGGVAGAGRVAHRGPGRHHEPPAGRRTGARPARWRAAPDPTRRRRSAPGRRRRGARERWAAASASWWILAAVVVGSPILAHAAGAPRGPEPRVPCVPTRPGPGDRRSSVEEMTPRTRAQVRAASEGRAQGARRPTLVAPRCSVRPARRPAHRTRRGAPRRRRVRRRRAGARCRALGAGGAAGRHADHRRQRGRRARGRMPVPLPRPTPADVLRARLEALWMEDEEVVDTSSSCAWSGAPAATLIRVARSAARG